MKRQLGISAALHLAAILALLITIPSLTQEMDLSEQIIPVDIVNVADVTSTKVSPTPSPKPAPTPTKSIAPQPTEQQQPKPPEPPKPPDPKPPEKQPTPDDKAEIIPDKTKPIEKPKPPEPPKPPEEKPKDKPPEKPTPPKDALASVLKNIQKLKDTTPTSPKPNPDATEVSDKPVTSTAAPAAGAQLTISELDALRRQISQCWNVPSGARGIETMQVELYLEVDENRMPTRVEVVDRARYVADSFFRTVAESAVRAIRNPHCNPLALPPDKYSEWNKIRMTFNPKDMM